MHRRLRRAPMALALVCASTTTWGYTSATAAPDERVLTSAATTRPTTATTQPTRAAPAAPRPTRLPRRVRLR